MTHDTGYRKTSLIDEDWEELDIKPPVDLIPDEFKRESNKKILVEIVLSQRDPEAIDFKDFMISLDYVVSETYYDGKGIDKTPPGTQWLTQVQNKILTSEFEGLIMVFAKVSYKSEDMKKIWSMFTAPNCPTLKDKPKIFLFQLLKRIVQFDAAIMRKTWSAKYDTPAEADIAVIYDKYDPDQRDFFSLLSEIIKKNGETEDLTIIISLCGMTKVCQPMLMSTMTGKFYFLLHEHRGNHHRLHTKSDQAIEHVKSIQSHVSEENHLGQKEPKKPGVIKRFVKRISSMRKSRDDNKVGKNYNNDALSGERNSSSVADVRDAASQSTTVGVTKIIGEEYQEIREQYTGLSINKFKGSRKSSLSSTAEMHQTGVLRTSRVVRSEHVIQAVSSSIVGTSTRRRSTNILPIGLRGAKKNEKLKEDLS